MTDFEKQLFEFCVSRYGYFDNIGFKEDGKYQLNNELEKFLKSFPNKNINTIKHCLKKWIRCGFYTVPHDRAPLLSGRFDWHVFCTNKDLPASLKKYAPMYSDHIKKLFEDEAKRNEEMRIREEMRRTRRYLAIAYLHNPTLIQYPSLLFVSDLTASKDISKASYQFQSICTSTCESNHMHVVPQDIILIPIENADKSLLEYIKPYMHTSGKVELDKDKIHCIAYQKLFDSLHLAHYPRPMQLSCFISAELFPSKQDTEEDIKEVADYLFNDFCNLSNISFYSSEPTKIQVFEYYNNETDNKED